MQPKHNLHSKTTLKYQNKALKLNQNTAIQPNHNTQVQQTKLHSNQFTHKAIKQQTPHIQSIETSNQNTFKPPPKQTKPNHPKPTNTNTKQYQIKSKPKLTTSKLPTSKQQIQKPKTPGVNQHSKCNNQNNKFKMLKQ